MSTQENELRAVKERIEIFAAKLRGHDSGGDDGMFKIDIASDDAWKFMLSLCLQTLAVWSFIALMQSILHKA